MTLAVDGLPDAADMLVDVAEEGAHGSGPLL